MRRSIYIQVLGMLLTIDFFFFYRNHFSLVLVKCVKMDIHRFENGRLTLNILDFQENSENDAFSNKQTDHSLESSFRRYKDLMGGGSGDSHFKSGQTYKMKNRTISNLKR